MTWLTARGWLEGPSALVVRCLLAVAVAACVMYLATGTAEYRAYWNEPGMRERFSLVLPEFIRFGLVHLPVPVVFALCPRRWTNILFWAYALYLPLPWLEVVLDDGHAVIRTMVGWFALHGIAVFSVGFYTLWKAIQHRRGLLVEDNA